MISSWFIIPYLTYSLETSNGKGAVWINSVDTASSSSAITLKINKLHRHVVRMDM